MKLCEIAQEVKYTETNPLEAGLDRYVGLEHLDPEELRISRWGNIVDGVSFTRKFKAGQILFGRRRAYQKKAAIPDFDGICSGDIIVIEPIKGKIVPELLPYIIQNDSFFAYAVSESAGSLSPRVKWKQLAEYEVDLPDNDTQYRIVELMKAFDESINAKYSILKSLVEVKQGISSFAEKTGWEVKKLIEVSELIMGQSPSSESYNSNGKGLPFIQGNTEFGEKYPTIYKWCSEPKKLAKKGDVLITVRAPVGEVNIATAETCIGRGVAAIRPIGGIDAELLFYLIQSEKRQFHKISQGSIFDSIDKKQLSDLQIVIPPIAKREKILADFYAIENAMKHLQKNLHVSHNMRKKILNTLILGGDHQ